MNMRDLFPGYYQPTEQEFDVLWKECIFSFDTNVLLHIYRYTPSTRDRLFEILQKLKERIWIPYQVGYEYQKERLNVISGQSKAYDEIDKTLDTIIKPLKTKLQNHNKHSFIKADQIIQPIEEVIKTIRSSLQQLKKDHPDLTQSDELREKLAEILDGRIGEPYPNDKLKEIYKDAEQRFKASIPPGYKDSQKPERDKYGDVVLWFQLLDYAKLEKKPLIFITDDDKEDWWLKRKGKTISPQPELVQEIFLEASVQFHMYTTDKFMEYAEEYLYLTKQQEAIDEAKEIRIQDTSYQKGLDAGNNILYNRELSRILKDNLMLGRLSSFHNELSRIIEENLIEKNLELGRLAPPNNELSLTAERMRLLRLLQNEL